MTTETLKQCAWKSDDGTRCPDAAKPRTGPKGPIPKFCAFHTAEKKREQDRRPRGIRPAYEQCCRDWQAAGNPGLCNQHEVNRDSWREFHAWWSERFQHSTGERKNLVAALDIRSGVHIEKLPANEPESAVNADPKPVRIVYPSEMEKAGFLYDEYFGWLLNDDWHRLYMEDPEEFDMVLKGDFSYA